MILIKESMSSTPLLQINLHQTHRRLTRPRQVVQDVVRNASHHLTPAEIYARARVKDPHIGLATVYRSLDLLVELGHLQRIHLKEGCHSYAPSEKTHGHHRVCSSCGRIEEFAGCDLEPLIKSLRRKTGYAIDVHMFEVMGRCPRCQSKGHAPNRTGENRKVERNKRTSAS
jgi:Fur family ferric uptake transcriptional regulator